MCFLCHVSTLTVLLYVLRLYYCLYSDCTTVHTLIVHTLIVPLPVLRLYYYLYSDCTTVCYSDCITVCCALTLHLTVLLLPYISDMYAVCLTVVSVAKIL